MSLLAFKEIIDTSTGRSFGHLYENSEYCVLFGNKNLKKENLPNIIVKSPSDIHFMNQQHTNVVLQTPIQNQVCDGLVSSDLHDVLGIRTADCLPLIGVSNTLVAALHCGRRGSIDGIISRLTEFKDLDLHSFFIGPHIHAQSYEIGREIHNQILNLYPDTSSLEEIKGKLCFNLSVFAKEQIQHYFPLAQIFTLEIDTFIDHNYNSYRRDNNNLERNLSLVWKKGSHED